MAATELQLLICNSYLENINKKRTMFLEICTNGDYEKFTNFLLTKPDWEMLLESMQKFQIELNENKHILSDMLKNNESKIATKINEICDICKKYEKELDKYISYYDEFITA